MVSLDDGMHQEQGVTAGLVVLIVLMLTLLIVGMVIARTSIRITESRPAPSAASSVSGLSLPL